MALHDIKKRGILNENITNIGFGRDNEVTA